MDLIAEDEREQTFVQREALIKGRSQHFQMKCFATSIWDETLYRAWSQIVYSLIPNVEVLKSQLTEFASICGAEEIVLFERATFLVISDYTCLSSDLYDRHRSLDCFVLIPFLNVNRLRKSPFCSYACLHLVYSTRS